VQQIILRRTKIKTETNAAKREIEFDSICCEYSLTKLVAIKGSRPAMTQRREVAAECRLPCSVDVGCYDRTGSGCNDAGNSHRHRLQFHAGRLPAAHPIRR
jgi:hypothetical protein